jgi:hypothetical protein
MTYSILRLLPGEARSAVAHALCLAVLLAGAPVAGASAPVAAPPPGPTAPRVSDALPMGFEPNLGQAASGVDFVARGRDYAVMLTGREAVLALGAGSNAQKDGPRLVRLRLEGASAAARATGERRLPGTSNYLRGADSSKWLRGIPTFGAVRYEQVYRGVDFVVYGNDRQLEYDFVVAPGADPSAIRLAFEGAEDVRVDEGGDLVMRLAGSEVRQRRAAVYQETATGRRDVAARYAVAGDGTVRLDVADYDRRAPLVVDPVLVYADFLGGGESYDEAEGMTVDAAGAIYLAGTTNAIDFPATPGAYDTSLDVTDPYNARTDCFVAKLAPDGASLAYATFLGGSFYESALAVAVGPDGQAVVTGQTDSPNFPTTPGAFDRTLDRRYENIPTRDAFVTRLSADGSALVYSTFLGGGDNDAGADVALGADGSAYVVGRTHSLEFPTTPGAFDRGFNSDDDSDDVFLVKLAPNGASLAYGTFLGGYLDEDASSVAVSPAGEAVVGGSTISTADFPLTPGAFDQIGISDFSYAEGFVARFNAAGSALVFSTYLGGSASDRVNGVAVGADGSVYAVGQTQSNDFPTTSGAVGDPRGGIFQDAFMTRLAPNGQSAIYSAVLGSNGECEFVDVEPAAGGAVAVGTADEGFPTTPGAFDTTANGSFDAVVVKLNDAGTDLVFSTYFGGGRSEIVAGVGIDAAGRIAVGGGTQSLNLPTTAGAVEPSFRGATDAFAFRLSANGASLDYATYVSGTISTNSNVGDSARDVAVDAAGAAYVTGWTYSVNFPVTPGAFDGDQGAADGGYYSLDGFVTKLAPDGQSLVYSTYLGGSDYDEPGDIALGPGGVAFVSGRTYSLDFPTTPGAFDRTLAESEGSTQSDAFVAKLAADGGSLLYGTYLGGIGEEFATGVAVGPDGAAHVSGYTDSLDFPTTPGAFDRTVAGQDGFALKVSVDGTSLVYSTYLGGFGFDQAEAIAVDATGAAYVVGSTTSTNFPTTPGAFDTTYNGSFRPDAFVTRLAPNGSTLGYSTFLGGTDEEVARAIAVDASGAAYVAGGTQSTDFPTTPGAFDTTFGSFIDSFDDAFVTKVAPGGASLVYSTYVGAEWIDTAYDVAVDGEGRAYVAGDTGSEQFPVTPGAFDPFLNDGGFFPTDGFATVVAADGADLAYSTYIGAGGDDTAHGVATDAEGMLYVVGDASSVPYATSTFPEEGFGTRDASNGFVLKLTPEALPSFDSIGLYAPDTGTWFLRNTNAAGNADLVFGFGAGGLGLVPLTGDWDGDGDDTIGLYDPSSGAFFLRNANAPGGADAVLTFGPGGGGFVPLTGDWDGDGDDTVGLYLAASGVFFLRNSNTPGPADLTFSFGPGGDSFLPLTGDWDGDGDETVGIYYLDTGTFFLKNANAPGSADLVFSFGSQYMEPLAGDWDGDGDDTVGVRVPASNVFFLTNSNAGGAANLVFGYGPNDGTTAVAGNWDGQ